MCSPLRGRRITAAELWSAAAHNGTEPYEFTVGWDAVAVYVNDCNPLDHIYVPELAAICGDGGAVRTWPQLRVRNGAGRGDVERIEGRHRAHPTDAVRRRL